MRLPGKWGMVLLCLLLAGCGGGDSGTGADGTPTPASGIAAVPMTLAAIVWSEDVDEESGAPTSAVTMFTPQSPAIIASIEGTGIPAGTEFTAVWMLNGTPIEDSDPASEQQMLVRSDADLGRAWVSFRFTREEGQRFPPGQLSVVITASTGEVRQGAIAIGFP